MGSTSAPSQCGLQGSAWHPDWRLTKWTVPSRESGLFPPGDALLLQLASEAQTHPFEKHLAGETSPYELLNNGSWTSGDEACQAGFDLRLFYRVGYYTFGNYCEC